MPILKAAGKLILFVHIPKTGGSSVEAYMRAKGPVALHAAEALPDIRPRPQHFDAAILDAIFPDGFLDERFAVLRDPLDRLVSEYRFRARPATSLRSRLGLGTGAEVKVDDGVRKPLSFAEWAREVMERQADRPTLLDNHIRPQADFLSGGETLFRLEDGLDAVYAHIDALTDGRPGPVRPHEKRATFPRPDVDAETQARVRDFYARDYALLGPSETMT